MLFYNEINDSSIIKESARILCEMNNTTKFKAILLTTDTDDNIAIYIRYSASFYDVNSGILVSPFGPFWRMYKIPYTKFNVSMLSSCFKKSNPEYLIKNLHKIFGFYNNNDIRYVIKNIKETDKPKKLQNYMDILRV